MAVPKFSDFELKVEFRDNYIVHTADGLEDIWSQGEIIGRGAFGKVFVQQRQGGEQLRAVKEVALAPMIKTGVSQELLAFVTTKDHDDLFVKFLGWYKNSHDMFFVMEYLKDGDLGVYMAKEPQRAKENAKEITVQILRGLEVLHKKKICHRDLKPQNILIASLTPVWVKIADFGVAKQTADSTAKSGWGTDNYRAPELICGFLPDNRSRPKGLSYALDIWSLGSLLHELLTSQTPFLTINEPESGIETHGVTDMGIFFNYCRGNIEFPIIVLKDSEVSKEGIDFVKSLLVASPEKRPTAASTLRHTWLKGYTNNLHPPPQSAEEVIELGKALQPPSMPEARNVDNTSRPWFWNTAETAEPYASSLILKLQNPWSADNGLLLLKKIEAGNVNEVGILLKSMVDTNSGICQEGFLLAVKLGHFDIVKLFLSSEADVETSSDDLQKECATGNRYVNAREAHNGRTALQVAAESGHIDIVKLLLDSKADVNARAAHNGWTALQAAAGSGHTNIVKLLLVNKADVNAGAAEVSGRTALQVAAGGGHIGIVKLLLENKADARAGYKGLAALQAAAKSGHIDIVRLLLSDYKYEPNSPIGRYYSREDL